LKFDIKTQCRVDCSKCKQSKQGRVEIFAGYSAAVTLTRQSYDREQGDQMSLEKKSAQNVAQSVFFGKIETLLSLLKEVAQKLRLKLYFSTS
jgi:hypothetical protein